MSSPRGLLSSSSLALMPHEMYLILCAYKSSMLAINAISRYVTATYAYGCMFGKRLNPIQAKSLQSAWNGM